MTSNSPERDTGGGAKETEAKIYPCKFCDLDYVFRNDCKIHVLNIHGVNTYECDVCPGLFYDEKELSEHTKTVHHGQKRHFCTHCSRSYKTAKQLTVHIDYKHKIENAVACERCGQEFHNNVAYRKHLELHHKPHHIYEKCSKCDRSFRCPHHLNLHKEFDHRKGGKNKLLEYMKKLNIDKSLTTDATRCKSCNIKFKCSIDLIQHLKINHARKIRKFACCQCKEAVYLSRAALGIHMRYDHGMLNHSCKKCPPPKKPPKNPAPLKRKKIKPKSNQNVTPYVSKQNNKGRRRINDGSMLSLYNVNIHSPNIKLSEKAKKRKAPWADRFIKENIPSDLERVEDGNLENLRHNIRTVFNILSTVAPSRLKASVTTHLSSVTSRNVFGKNVNVLSIMFPSIIPSLPQCMSSNIESSNTPVSAVKKSLNPLKALDSPNVTENVIKNKHDTTFEKSNTDNSFNTDNSLNQYPKSLNTIMDIVEHVEPNITPNVPKEKKRKQVFNKIMEEETSQSNDDISYENTNNNKSTGTTKFLNQSVSVPLKKRKLCHEKIYDNNSETKKKENKTVKTTKTSKKEPTPLQLYKIPKITLKNFSKDMKMLNSVKNVNTSCEETIADNANIINVEKENSTDKNTSKKDFPKIDTNLDDSQPKLISADATQVSVEGHASDEINTLEYLQLQIQENSTSTISNTKESSNVQKKSTKKLNKKSSLKKKVSLTPKIQLRSKKYCHKTLTEKKISRDKLSTRKMLKTHKIETQVAMSKVKSANIENSKVIIKMDKTSSPETQSHKLEKCSELNIPSHNINEKSSIWPTDCSTKISEEILSKVSCTYQDTGVKQIKVDIPSNVKKAKKEKQKHKEHIIQHKQIKGDSQSAKEKVTIIDNLDSKPMSKNKTQSLLPESNDTQEKLSESQTSGILKEKVKHTSSRTDTGNVKPIQTSPHKKQPTTPNSIDKEFTDDSSNTVEKELSILFDMPIPSLESQSEESNLPKKIKPLPVDTPVNINKVVLNPNIASQPGTGKRRHKFDATKRMDIKSPSSNEGKPKRRSNSLPVEKSVHNSDKVMPPKLPSTEKTNTTSPTSPKKNAVSIGKTSELLSANQNKSNILPIPSLGTQSEVANLTKTEKIKPIPGDDTPVTINNNPNIASSTSDKRKHKSDVRKRMDIKSPPSSEGKPTRRSNSLPVEKSLHNSDKVMQPKLPSKEKTNTTSPTSPKKNAVPIGKTSELLSADQNKSIILPILSLGTQSEEANLTKKEKIKPIPGDDIPVTINNNPNIASPTSDKRGHKSDVSKRMDIKSPSSNEGKPTRRSNSLPVEKSQNDSDKVMTTKLPSKEKTNTISPTYPKKNSVPIGKTSELLSADQNKSIILPIPSLGTQSEERNLTKKEKRKPIPGGDTPVTFNNNSNIASPTSDKRKNKSDMSKRMDIKSPSSNEGKPTRRSKSLPIKKIPKDSDKLMPPKLSSKEKTGTITASSAKKNATPIDKTNVVPIDKTSPLAIADENKLSKKEVQISPLLQEIPLNMEEGNTNTAKGLDTTVQEVAKVFDKITSPEKKSDTQSSLANNVKAKSPIKKVSVSTPLKSSNSEIYNLKNKEQIKPLSEKASVSTDKAALSPTIATQTSCKRKHKSDVNKRIDVKSASSSEGISTRCSNSLSVEKSLNRKRKSEDAVKVMSPKSPSKEKINEKFPSSPKEILQIAEKSSIINTDRENLPNTNNNFVDPKKEVIQSSQSEEISPSTKEIKNIVKPLDATVQEFAKFSEIINSPEKISLTPSPLTSIKVTSPIKKVIVIPVGNKVVLSSPEIKSPEKIQSANVSPVKPITAKRIIITKDMILKSSPCKTVPNVLRPDVEGLRVVMSASNTQNSSNIENTTNITCENTGNITISSSLGVTNESKSPIIQIASKVDTGKDDKKPTVQQMQNTNNDNRKQPDSVSLENLPKSGINDNKNEKTAESKIMTSEDEDNGKRMKKLQILLHRVDELLLLDKNKELETTEKKNEVQDMKNEEHNEVRNTSSQINYEQGIPMDDYHGVDSSCFFQESHFEEVQYDETGQNVLEVANYVDVETTGSPLHSEASSPVPMIASPMKEYTCTFCCMKFGDEIFLLNHLTEVHTYDENGAQAQSSKTLYKCRSCGSGFRQKDALDKHIKEEHVNTGAYNCEYCSATYLYKYHLKRHVRNAHPAVLNATCDICMKKFNTFAALHSHGCGTSAEPNVVLNISSNEEIIEILPANEQNPNLNVEGLKKVNEQEFVDELNSPPKKQVRFLDLIKEPPGEKKPVLTSRVSKKRSKYSCNKCKSSFQNGLFLFNHARLHHKDSILKCGTCKLEFMNSVNFKQHVCKTVTKFECKKCLLLFTNRNALLEHRKEKHNMGTLKCDFCSKYFKTNTNLVKHIAAKHIESSEYTNAVNLPSKKMKWRSSSQMTSDIYDDLKIINQASSQAIARQVLVKSHSNGNNSRKVQKRNICKKIIKRKKDIILHSELKRIHHRYHKCLKCSRKFSHKTLLIKHIKHEHRIEPNKIYRCTECSAVFKFQDKLLQHNKMKHGQIKTIEKLLSPSQNNAAMNKIRKQRGSKHTGNKEPNTSTRREQTTRTDAVIAQDVTVGQMYNCAECKAYLPSKDSLQRHMQWEHMKVGKCGHCGEVFATAEEFLRHLMTGHANEKIKEVLPTQLALPESRFKWKTQLAYKHERQAE